MSNAVSRKKEAPTPPVRQTISWQQMGPWKALLPSRSVMRRWVVRALNGLEAEITVRFVDEEEGHSLNLQYRHKDYATNVLTFDYYTEPVIVADIVICVPVLARQAQEQNKTFREHLAHLLVHATLHARGYDHENLEEAERMEALETDILVGLKFQPPYTDSPRRGSPVES